MLEQIFEIATGQVSATDMLQELYSDVAWRPSQGWSNQYQDFTLDPYDEDVNKKQNDIARKVQENMTVNVLHDPMADDMRKVDLLQMLRHKPDHPLLHDPRSPYYRWSEGMIRTKIDEILEAWKNGGAMR